MLSYGHTMVKNGVYGVILIRRKMIKEHGDSYGQGWMVLFFAFWITVTIIWNYFT